MTKDKLLQVLVSEEDRRAFDAWCRAAGTTMSDLIRAKIAPYILEGKELLGGRDKSISEILSDRQIALLDAAGYRIQRKDQTATKDP